MDDGQDVSEEDLGSYMDVIANLCEQRDAVRTSRRQTDPVWSVYMIRWGWPRLYMNIAISASNATQCRPDALSHPCLGFVTELP